MAVGILVNKEKRTIHDIFDNVIDIEPQKINYDGGYVEGFDESAIEVIVTNDITTEIVPIINEQTDDGIPMMTYKTVFRDNGGIEIMTGSTLPADLLNIKGQFVKQDTDLQSKRISDLELMVAELLYGI